jgi:UDP-glucuronate 4-epimerase
MKVLVTGSAGFIGFHLAQKLIAQKYEVVGLDNLNDYYELSLKYGRLKAAGIDGAELVYNKALRSKIQQNYRFIQLDLTDRAAINTLFETEKFDMVVNLAAQAGVRYSLENPHAYIDSNVVGFTNILEACRHNTIQHLVYASSSSVYGLNESVPYSTSHHTDHPISLYAATKKANELMAHAYSHLYQLPTTGLRFFTVYGPWGRPDMAYFLFTKAIIAGEPIKIFNDGKMYRDFTYVDDIVAGIVKVLHKVPQGENDWNAEEPNPSAGKAPYRLYNIGNNKPVNLLQFIETLEQALGQKAEKIYLPLQPGDMTKTWANVDDLMNDFDYQPSTPLKKGIEAFVAWYLSFYGKARG